MAISVSKELPDFTSLLVEKGRPGLSFSSGESVVRVGMIRYRVLELIEKLLSINEL